MPRYDYRCPDGHVREVQHGMNATPEILCTEAIEGACRSEDCKSCLCLWPMTRVIGAAAIIPVPGMAAFDKRLPPIKVNGKVHRP